MPDAVSQAEFARAMRRIAANDDLTTEDPLADDVTAMFPGTEEKILVMAQRARRKRRLFHNDDITVAQARKMGFLCSRAANGETIWFRPVDELGRRELILNAIAARKLARQEGTPQPKAG